MFIPFLVLRVHGPAATEIVPLTSPAAETFPFPMTSPKTPVTGTSPHMLLLFSRTSDLDASSVHDPASFPSWSNARNAADVSCPADVISLSFVLAG